MNQVTVRVPAWLLEALDYAVSSIRELEKATRASVIRRFLEERLKDMKPDVMDNTRVPVKLREKKRRLTVDLAKEDRWLLGAIEKVIIGKKQLGIDTSWSFEVARLLKKGLRG